jgi:hypothetical protein
MPKSGIFLEHTGPVDYKTIDHILKNIKITKEYIGLQKTVAKRVYAILEECLENIAKHSLKDSAVDGKKQPFISAGWQNDKIVINARNPVYPEKKEKLNKMLDFVNHLDQEELTHLHNEKINSIVKQDVNGAGLGFIIMRLKSGNRIDYRFTPIDNILSSFEILISINTNIMRKLIIEQTASSPRVILDPDRNIFEIAGESRPPDVTGFYNEILQWIEEYSIYLGKAQPVKSPVIFNLDFEYFNSSSAKYILDFCKQIGTVRSKGKDVAVKWHYEKNDMDMLEVGREMSRMAKIPFEYVQKN